MSLPGHCPPGLKSGLTLDCAGSVTSRARAVSCRGRTSDRGSGIRGLGALVTTRTVTHHSDVQSGRWQQHLAEEGGRMAATPPRVSAGVLRMACVVGCSSCKPSTPGSGGRAISGPAPPCPHGRGSMPYLSALRESPRPPFQDGAALPALLSLVRNRMSLESRWLLRAGQGLELPCDTPALEAAVHAEGAPPNLALQLQGPRGFVSAVVLGQSPPLTLLLHVNHRFLSRPAACISNAFPFPNMQILASFAPLGECF